LRKRPLGECNETLIYVDAPGSAAITKPIPPASTTAGFILTADEKIEVVDARGNTISEIKVHIEVGVDKTGKLSASP